LAIVKSTRLMFPAEVQAGSCSEAWGGELHPDLVPQLEMHAALEVNIPNYAAVVTTSEVLEAISATGR
jgi:hypothetical protein